MPEAKNLCGFMESGVTKSLLVKVLLSLHFMSSHHLVRMEVVK